MVDWKLSGPAAGVGAKARVRVKSPGPDDWLDMTVISGDRPRTTTEESVGAGGKRRTRGTYTLEELPDGGTRITFELAWLEAPLSERLAAPISRTVVGRANAKALRRLADVLADNEKEEARGSASSQRGPEQSVSSGGPSSALRATWPWGRVGRLRAHRRVTLAAPSRR